MRYNENNLDPIYSIFPPLNDVRQVSSLTPHFLQESCDLSFYFTYTTQTINAAIAAAETTLFIGTVLILGYWSYLIYFQLDKDRRKTAFIERNWLTIFLVGLLFYQNPIYCFAQYTSNTNVLAAFLSDCSVTFGEAVFFSVWLFFVDGFRSRDSVTTWRFYAPKLAITAILLIGNFGMIALSFPSLFDKSRSPVLAIDDWSQELVNVYFAFAVFFTGALCLWFIYFFYLVYDTAKKFSNMVYLQHRYIQLSFRFFLLQAVLVITAYCIVYIATLVYGLLKDIISSSTGIRTFTNNINHFLMAQTQPFGKILFISFYAYITLYLHLPPERQVMTIISTYYVVTETEHRQLLTKIKAFLRKKKKKMMSLKFLGKETLGRTGSESSGADEPSGAQGEKKRRFFEFGGVNIPSVFCLEIAAKMMDVAWQAYFDEPDKKTSGGWGSLELEESGYDLIGTIYDEVFDSFVLVVRHKTSPRVVVAFRGSSSQKQWLNNLRFKQTALDYSELPKIEYDQYIEEEWLCPTQDEGSGISTNEKDLGMGEVST